MAFERKQDEDIEAGVTNCHTTSNTSITVKAAFRTWIQEGRSKQYNPDSIIVSWDNVSDELLRCKLLSVPLWEITNKESFLDIYIKAMNNELFRVTDRKTYTAFVQIGKLYLRFLNRKSVLRKAVRFNLKTDTKLTELVVNSSEQSYVTLPHVDFSRPELCAHTNPMSCTINGQAVVLDKQSWPRLLVSITEWLITEKNPYLAELDRRSMSGGKVFLMSEKADYGTCPQLSNGKWIYTNYTSQTIVTIIGKLCRHCGLALDDVVITYLPNKEHDLGNELVVSLSTELNAGINDNVKAAVVSILEERFPNGIRPNSVIDKNKLRNYYCQATGEKILSEKVISSLLNTIGIRHGGKVYPIPLSGKRVITQLIDRIIAEGNRVFCYSEFYDVHADYLQQIHVYSAELLRTVLTSLLPSLYYSRVYFSVNNNESPESEVLRCFQTAVCLSYQQLKEKLPYVSLDKIKQVLVNNSDFILVNKGAYTHVSKLEIDEVELRAINQKIEEGIVNHGYISLATIDVMETLELNSELSEAAVKNGLYQVCLSERYEKRGHIITPKGSALNALAVLEDYCLTHDRLTLNELLGFEKEIYGRVHSQSLFVAYNTMVRINRDTFVGDSEIRFDVDATDNALALFLHTDVIPLQNVTSYTLFPYIEGFQWNWYLLESFCKRFSKRFMYQCLSVNSRNVGAIYRKSAGFTDYIDVLAAAVAASKVELNEKVVGDYLFGNRYVAQRTTAVSKVMAKAQALRGRRV